MAITPPSAGDPIDATWGAAVANQLNTSMSPTKASDQTRDSTDFVDITDLTFPVVNGTAYTAIVVITWAHANASGGPVFSFNHPGGTCRMLIEHTGETSSTSSTKEWITTNDGGSGVATVDTINVARMSIGYIRYSCTADGTFAMRFARNTTGVLTVQAGASLFVTSS
jgi:hypothetical protein